MNEIHGFQVLLVEDDPGERWIVSEILRSRGHQVTACETAELGWDRFQETSHPLVLLDWLLPGMDGLELCRRIRNHPRGDQTVVVMVTSRDEPEDLEEVLRAGADDYVTKPIDVGLMNIRLAVAEKDVQDVRAQKRTQDALEARSRELQTLFENLDEVFFTVDARADELVQVSPGAGRILGRSPEELRGDPDLWRAVLFPEDLQEELAGAGEDGTASLTRQYRIGRPDGESRWLEATVKASRDDEGRLDRVDGIVSDVTEEKRAQRELSARNEELRTLYRISEVVLAAASLDEAYQEILEEIRRATGYPIVAVEHFDEERERMVIRAAAGLSLDDDERSIPIHRTLSGVAVQERAPVVEPDVRSRSEHDHDLFRRARIRAYISVPMFVSGRVVGTLTLAHTEVREPDPRLVRWIGSLANSIATLVDRLAAQEALVESERKHRALARQLRQANEELEAFAYSVSHDLRTPLRTMEGFAHALLDDFGDELPPEARDYVERIIASGEQSEKLIRDLLAYSRLSFEEVQLQAVDLSEVVELAREQVAGALEAADARLDVQDDLPRIRSHQATLVQVISNLLSNAVKFVPPDRTPLIEVGAEEVTEGARLWVQDNGVGIPPDQTDRIFKVFERLAESGDQPGTGIGLAIVRRGIERLGGRVGVESEPGEGSRFWIEIPRSSQPQPAPGQLASAQEPGASSS